MKNIVIDPEFKALIPALDSKEYEALEASILSEGCRDAVVVWGSNNILVDGHNRHEICTRHKLPYDVKYMEFDSRRDVRIWMRKNQIARRNIPAFLRVSLADDNADEMKQAALERRLANLKQSSVPSDDQKSDHRGRVNEQIAEETNTSHDTVNKVRQIKKRAPTPILKKAQNGDISSNRAYDLMREYEKLPKPLRDIVAETSSGDDLSEVQKIQTLFNKEPKQGLGIINQVRDGKSATFTEAIEKDAHAKTILNIGSSKSNEWYTPAKYVESARKVLGAFDVDPASNDTAQETVKATTYHTIATNGLDKDWRGRVWLNPPYGSENKKFIAKLIEEIQSGHITEAIVLVNSHSTDTNWFQPLWKYTLCFTNHRIDFIPGDGISKSSSNHGSVFIYIGSNADGFASEFSQYGTVVQQYVPKDIAKVA